jgi:hypothetical protein
MLTTDRQCRMESVAPAAGHQDGYAETAEQLRALAAGLSAMVETYEASPRSLDDVIAAGGGAAGHAETVIMKIYELMKGRVFAEQTPLQANPEVWAAFQEQRPEFISFFETVRAALETYSDILRMFQHVSGQAEYGVRPGELGGFRQDKHVQVEERRYCIIAVREFSAKFSAMLAVL